MKKRIAVLGGGPAGMTAAYYLSDPSLHGDYEVTVYQYGWRLGGKGACARNPDYGQRIEEHGLHQFLGFYDNAFRMIRELWPQWQAAPTTRFPTWDTAFTKQETITFMQKVTDERGTRWEPWNLKPPAWPGLPGDDGGVDFDDFLPRLLDWIGDQHRKTGVHTRAPVAHLTIRLAKLLSHVPHPTRNKPFFHGVIRELLHWIYQHVLPHTLREDIARDGQLLRIVYAAAKGFLTDVVPHGYAGFDRINPIEFRAWLMQHGAAHEDAWSAPVKSLYDAAFAYRTGDATKPEQNAQLAAGVALNAGLLMALGSRGSFLWKMNAGMGDTIFSPLHDVLRARGVKFEFFHRVENLVLDDDGRGIQHIELMRQVDLVKPYQPYVWVKDLPCWPHEPNWECIENGAAIKAELDALGITLESWWCTQSWARAPKVRLERGVDYDDVVLAIPPAALAPITQQLSAKSDAWRTMVERIPCIRTQAVQLWLKPTLAQLGWPYGSTVSVSYTEPLDSWGEMSQVLDAEDWGSGEAPQCIEYFCGAMPDEPADRPRSETGFPGQMEERAKENAVTWLSANIRPLWPDAALPGSDSLNWDLLLGGMDAQYWRANIDPSERYVLSTPDSMQYRMQTDGSGFDNLYLAGDWIVTRVNSGAFEAAVEAGCRASQAICGLPAHIFGVPAKP